jgi:hypothetical protein
MSRLAKFLWGFASLIAVGVVGYYALKNETVLNFAFPKSEFGEMLRNNLETGREWVANKVSSLAAPLAKKGEEAVSGVIQKAKDEVNEAVDRARLGAIDSVRKSLNEKFDEVVGVPEAAAPPASGRSVVLTNASPDGLAQIFPLSFSVKRGLPAVFVIKNTATAGTPLAFQVFWGDGRSEMGNIAPGESKTLFHVWELTGEFLIKVITGAGVNSKTYSSYIFVYP